MSAFHMDIAGTADRFQRIDRTGKSCAIFNDGSYMKVPCAWCGKPCVASADNCLTDKRFSDLKEKLNGQHNVMPNDISNMFPAHVVGYINKFVFNTDHSKEKYWKWVHSECVEFPSRTNSGRKVKSVKRFADQEFITGSGISGCDQYDRGFDGYVKTTEYQSYGRTDFSVLRDFITEDVEYEESKETSEEEEEWESGNETDEDFRVHLDCEWD